MFICSFLGMIQGGSVGAILDAPKGVLVGLMVGVAIYFVLLGFSPNVSELMNLDLVFLFLALVLIGLERFSGKRSSPARIENPSGQLTPAPPALHASSRHPPVQSRCSSGLPRPASRV